MKALKHLMPDKFKMTKRLISQKRGEREVTTQEMISLIKKQLEIFKLEAEVTGRPKKFILCLYKTTKI